MSTKKKIRPGKLEVNLEERAIDVHYDTEEYNILEDGSLELIKKKPGVKSVKVRELSSSSDIPALAAEIVEKSKLISSSKTAKIEALLRELLAAQEGGAGASDGGASGRGEGHAAAAPAAREESREREERRERRADRHRRDSEAGRAAGPPSSGRASDRGSAGGMPTGAQPLSEAERAELARQNEAEYAAMIKSQQMKYGQAYIEQLDDYMEDLYEEDLHKKVVATGMIGQLFRSTDLFEELLSRESLLPSLARVLREDGRKSVDLCINIIGSFFSLSNFSQFHPLIMEHQMGAMTMDLVDLEVKRTEHRAREEGVSPSMVAHKFMEARQGTVSLSDREKKLLALIQKQDRLLYVCFYMLLNLAEDVAVEKKMKKKNIVVYLVKMLDRSNVELLILAVTFLKKLSIYRENKDKMKECGIVSALLKFVPVRNDVLMMAVLRLLHNLSFDGELRDAMVAAGVVPRAVELMRDPRFQPVVMGLLYHVSMEDKYKTLFTYTDALGLVYEMILRVHDLRTTPELIALAVNLTQTPRNAEIICEGERFDRLIRRAVQTGDELTFKVLRNCSQQDSTSIKTKFAPYFEQLVRMLHAPDITGDLFVEILGTLANLNIPEFDFLNLVKRHDLLNFLAQYCQAGVVDDDILLEVVMFVGVLCTIETASLLVDSGLCNALFTLMGDKKEDDEFVLQIAFTFHKLLLFEPTRAALLQHTQGQVVYYLVDLLQDKNKQVRKTASRALDVIMDTEQVWAVDVRTLKFKAYNQEWLDATQADGGGGAAGGYAIASQYPEYDDYYSDEELDGDGAVGGNVITDFDDYASGWEGGDHTQFIDGAVYGNDGAGFSGGY